MANCYTQGNGALELFGEDRQFALAVLGCFNELVESCSNGEVSKPVHENELVVKATQAWFDSVTREFNPDDLRVDLEFCITESDEYGLKFYPEENITQAGVARFCHAVLKTLGSDAQAYVEVAYTSDRNSIGAFGGGALHITREGITEVDTGCWLHKAKANWEAKVKSSESAAELEG